MSYKYKISLSGFILVMILSVFIGCGSTESEDNTIIRSNEEVTEYEVDVEPEYQEVENIENSIEDLEEEAVPMMGYYKLGDAELKDPGMYIMYPDGSFSDYYTGSPLSWSATHMTYGIDSYFYDLVILDSFYKLNQENLEKGNLVIFCSKEREADKLWYDLYPVKETGRVMGNYDETWEVLFLESAANTYNEIPQFASWVRGSSVDYMNTKIKTINGIPVEEFTFPEYTMERKFVDLPEDEKYTVGVISGTAIEEKEYRVNCRYFLQEGDNCFYDIKLEPTVDGYAICDFSEIPMGNYILSISWFEERQRHVLTTCVTIP